MRVLPARLHVSVATAAFLGLSGCAGAPPAAPAPPSAATATTTATAAATATVTATAGPATAAHVDTVTIQNFLFGPADLTVAPGATVTVVNQDGANHTLTAKDHSFDTGNIPGNATGTFTAPTTPGTYPYDCAIHPFMTGTLTVS